MTIINYYRLLGVAQDASMNEIRARLRERQRTWTQRQNAPRPEQRQEAERNLGLVPEIKANLFDEVARKEYDRKLRTSTPERADFGEHPGASDLLSEGWRLVSDGNIPDALMAATTLTNGPGADNPDAWALLAYCQAQWGEPAQAVDGYLKAIRLRPNDASLYYDLGSAYEEIEEWSDAEHQYRRAAEIDQAKPRTGPRSVA